jgi:hypothetical protein
MGHQPSVPAWWLQGYDGEAPGRLTAMLSGLRQRFQHRRRRLLVVAAVVAMVAAVALAHSAPPDDHMGKAMTVCLAVAGTAALGILALGLAAAISPGGGPWPSASAPLSPGGCVSAVLPLPWPRGSPVALEVLLL